MHSSWNVVRLLFSGSVQPLQPTLTPIIKRVAVKLFHKTEFGIKKLSGAVAK